MHRSEPRKKYNWRTHEWKAGDRCLIKETAYGFEHRAECIPLRKKPKPELREYFVRETMFGPACIPQILDAKVNPKPGKGWFKVREVRK